jgi:hypothetical protein
MIKNSIEVLAEPIGFDISNSDDITQSNLLNGMGRGFNTYSKDKLDMQLCYVSQRLDKRTEDFILVLSEFIKLNREK